MKYLLLSFIIIQFCTMQNHSMDQSYQEFFTIKNNKKNRKSPQVSFKLDRYNYFYVRNKSENEMPALLQAIKNGLHFKTIRKIINHGDDVNEPNLYGQRALEFAVQLSNPEIAPLIVQLLLDNGAEVNAQNNSGDTALHAAVASFEKLDIVGMLLELEANPIIKNSKNITPLDIARHRHYTQATKMMEAKMETLHLALPAPLPSPAPKKTSEILNKKAILDK